MGTNPTLQVKMPACCRPSETRGQGGRGDFRGEHNDPVNAFQLVGAGVLVILWMTLSPKLAWFPAAWRNPFHGFLVIVFGTLAVLLAGALTTWLTPAARTQRVPAL